MTTRAVPDEVSGIPNNRIQRRELAALEIHNFRNIARASLDFAPGLNLISGANAAGKTSLLEAIYTLGRVRSFRTHRADQPIRYQQSSFRLVARIRSEEIKQTVIGIERGRDHLQVHLGGAPVRRLSELAGFFPVQVFSSDTDNIISGGPRYRRQVLDWALFHVEHGYRERWQRYHRNLRQRNAALRKATPDREIIAWDHELAAAAMQLHASRSQYVDAFTEVFRHELECLLPGRSMELRYSAGWPLREDLPALLKASLEKDRTAGFSRYGAHRCDFSILIDGKEVASYCSRGQQKGLVAAFLLAQIIHQQRCGAPLGVFLLDDLCSELDIDHQHRMLQALQDLQAQVFVTAIGNSTTALAGWLPDKRFHVEHGELREVL